MTELDRLRKQLAILIPVMKDIADGHHGAQEAAQRALDAIYEISDQTGDKHE